ncbi:chaplin [Streptomyces sp. NPDC060031]|uniref:chaplin n=1 Tax=Streptomyces sp. NPDC060031 TaxID=3347043 RepID=UPI00369BD2EE
MEVPVVRTKRENGDGEGAAARRGPRLRTRRGRHQGEPLHRRAPGVLSGDPLQVPIDVPVTVCGNTVNVIAPPNPAFGDTCVNA